MKKKKVGTKERRKEREVTRMKRKTKRMKDDENKLLYVMEKEGEIEEGKIERTKEVKWKPRMKEKKEG